MQSVLTLYQTRISEASDLADLRSILQRMDPSLVAETLPMVMEMGSAEWTEWNQGWQEMQEGRIQPDAWIDRWLDLIVPPPVARMQAYLVGESDD